MEIDLPETVAEIRAEFDRYEAALIENDVATLSGFFWRDPRAVRLAPGGGLYGYEAIAAFRRGRDVSDVARDLENVTIRALGPDCGVATAEYRRRGSGRRRARPGSGFPRAGASSPRMSASIRPKDERTHA